MNIVRSNLFTNLFHKSPHGSHIPDIISQARGLAYGRPNSAVNTSTDNYANPSQTDYQYSIYTPRFLYKRSFSTGAAFNRDTIMSSKDSLAGLPLKKVVNNLESIAPTSLAESWDNVGLLVEPSSPHQVTCGGVQYSVQYSTDGVIID